MPFAVVGSDKEYQVNGKRVLGRKTPWGIIEGNSMHPLAELAADQLSRNQLSSINRQSLS
jgi:septin 3/9/12